MLHHDWLASEKSCDTRMEMQACRAAGGEMWEAEGEASGWAGMAVE